MFREVIKQYREEKSHVCISLSSGKYVIGVIVNHGPEALLVQTDMNGQQLVMKQAIESIRPASDHKPARKR